MMKTYKYLLILFFILSFSMGKTFAVLNENNLATTLSELKIDLNKKYLKIGESRNFQTEKKQLQHQKMIGIIMKCNELSLMLYSQNQDWTFDMTYAFRQVTKEYDDFNENKMPYDVFLSRIEIEIEKYSRLIESLRRLPPQLKKVNNLPDSLAYHNDSLDTRVIKNFSFIKKDSLLNKQTSAFFLDKEGQKDRDSCLFYATKLLVMFAEFKDELIRDNSHYQDASNRLKESYDYAQERFRSIQMKIFSEPLDNYFKQIKSFHRNSESVISEFVEKYASDLLPHTVKSKSEWRGTIMATFFLSMLAFLVLFLSLGALLFKFLNKKNFNKKYAYVGVCVGIAVFSLVTMAIPWFTQNDFVALASNLLFTYSWIVDAIMISILIKYWNSNPRAAFFFYLPLILFILSVFMMRMIFVSNNFLNLCFPLVLLLTFLCQIYLFIKLKSCLKPTDVLIGRISIIVLAISAILSFFGYLFISILVVTWLFLQMAIIHTLMIFKVAIEYYRNRRGQTVIEEKVKGDNIKSTWFYDMIDVAIIPSLYILSFVQCIWEALHVFDMTDFFESVVYRPLINFSGTEEIDGLNITLYMLVIASALYFVFKYILYFIKSCYRIYKIGKFKKATGKVKIMVSDVNLTLANNLISISVWGLYVILIFVLFKIPTGTIAMIVTGLAAGIGMAMKDIMNNFIYGIQLMSGRLRLGDWIECDGIRGEVSDISYQCTQIETEDGAVMAFLNADLLGRNFKNLTKNNKYELIKLTVGISYGADIDQVRSILIDAFKPILEKKDIYGQNLIEPKYGSNIFFENFGESTVDVSVNQYVLVKERIDYIPMANEIIYNALNANNIEMPCPQRDVRIIK